MRTLESMVGEVVIARIAMLNGNRMMLVKLHGVERAGVWLECQAFTDRLMKNFRLSSSVTTPIVFVPFAKVDFIIVPLDQLSLSESAFGL